MTLNSSQGYRHFRVQVLIKFQPHDDMQNKSKEETNVRMARRKQNKMDSDAAAAAGAVGVAAASLTYWDGRVNL